MHCTGEGVINEVAHLIDGTARHHEYDVSPFQRTVMDLDLCAFVFDNQEVIIECLKKESGLGDKFEEGRNNFLQELIDKKFIFRTKQFKQFEEKAMLNAVCQRTPK